MHKPSGLWTLALFALFSLAACKKEYICSCSFSYVVDGQTMTETASYEDEFRSHSQAREACDGHAENYINTGASSAECVSVVK